jgi:hypothetical protein
MTIGRPGGRWRPGFSIREHREDFSGDRINQKAMLPGLRNNSESDPGHATLGDGRERDYHPFHPGCTRGKLETFQKNVIFVDGKLDATVANSLEVLGCEGQLRRPGQRGCLRDRRVANLFVEKGGADGSASLAIMLENDFLGEDHFGPQGRTGNDVITGRDGAVQAI